MTLFSEPGARVCAPSGFNYTPERFKRRMTDKARDADPWHKPEKKRGGWRYLAALVLLGMAVTAALTGCSKTEPVSMADTKRAAAGAWACPGMTAVWLDEKTVQCLKEKP